MDTLYAGIQDCMKSLNVFYKQTASKLRELQILGEFCCSISCCIMGIDKLHAFQYLILALIGPVAHLMGLKDEEAGK
jgi:hypothetical protein